MTHEPETPDDVAAELAEALAGRLRHLRRFSGLRYVPSVAPAHSVLAAEAPVTRPPASAEPAAAAVPAPAKESVGDVQARLKRKQAGEWTPAKKLEYLRTKNVGDCRRCALSRTRSNIVFGVGNPSADTLFVGEGPGYHEDKQGEPFVGAAGKRLDEWIEAIGSRRPDVYIANVVKCRPPKNRDPTPKEVASCSPFLHAQIRAIEPKVIVALGRFAANELLGLQSTMSSLRGRLHTYHEPKSGRSVPVLVVPHPAYVLRRDAEGTAGAPDNSAPRKSENERVIGELTQALALLREDSLT